MTAATQVLGEFGERIAERWLRRRGWRVVNRRFRNGRRDIDLVVEQDLQPMDGVGLTPQHDRRWFGEETG